MTRFLAIEELHPGDVLLSRGRGDISRWMAWNGESRYTHAAIVVDAQDCVEAVMPATRRHSLLRHVAAPNELIDVFRPRRAGDRPLDAADHARIARIAAGHLGRPFAASWMLPLALRTLMHHKLGLAPAPGGHRSSVTCTELVYLILDEAIGMPVPRARRRERFPRPSLRPRRLWSEYLRFRGSRSMPDDITPDEITPGDITPDNTTREDITDGGIVHKDITHDGIAQAPMPGTAPYSPKRPVADTGKDLLPGDLAGSAALRHLGRLR